MKLIKVITNQEVEGIFTERAYKEYEIQMNTGDCHIAIPYIGKADQIIDLRADLTFVTIERI